MPVGNKTGLGISALVSALMLAAMGGPVAAQGTLRIAMTASDVPTTTGVPNNGFEGVRFLGFTAFDSLVLDGLVGLLERQATNGGRSPVAAGRN